MKDRDQGKDRLSRPDALIPRNKVTTPSSRTRIDVHQFHASQHFWRRHRRQQSPAEMLRRDPYYGPARSPDQQTSKSDAVAVRISRRIAQARWPWRPEIRRDAHRDTTQA